MRPMRLEELDSESEAYESKNEALEPRRCFSGFGTNAEDQGLTGTPWEYRVYQLHSIFLAFLRNKISLSSS